MTPLVFKPSMLVWACALALVASTAAAQDADPEFAAQPSKFAGYALGNERADASDYVRDILVLVDLGEAEFAKPLVDELTALQLSDQQRAELVSTFGTAKLHKLARTAELGQQAADFALACITAAGQAADNPERLSQLIEQAATGDSRARQDATRGLQAAGQQGVSATAAALADATDAKRQSRLREALVRMAPLSTPVLAAMLDAPADAVRQQAAWALGQIGDRASIPRLAAIAAGPKSADPVGKAALWSLEKMVAAKFSPASAEPLLRSAIMNAAAGVPARRTVEGDSQTVWMWDAAANQPTASQLTREEASQVRTARLAADLWRLSPNDTARTSLALASRLQAESLLAAPQGALAMPGPVAAETEPHVLVQALQLAIEENLTGGAAQLAAAIGAKGEAGVLYTPHGAPSALASALTATHPAVRFAALEAIMQLDPKSPFPGSSEVAPALLHFASSDGESAAVVASPKTEAAATISGRLAGAGIQGIATNLGSQVICLAADRPDVEFVMLDMGVLRPNVREVLFRVRRLTSTADLPVVLLAAEGQLQRAKQLAREHDRVLVYPRPHNTADTLSIAAAARALAPRGLPSPEQRAEQATAAAGWIERLLSQGPKFYNVRARSEELLAAVNRSADIDSTIPSLALVGTPGSQLTLVNLASQGVTPIATRDAAAAAFDKSVEQHGLLLTKDQILNQYDRYNASEASDAETQRVLGALLDSIESLRDDG